MKFIIRVTRSEIAYFERRKRNMNPSNYFAKRCFWTNKLGDVRKEKYVISNKCFKCNMMSLFVCFALPSYDK